MVENPRMEGDDLRGFRQIGQGGIDLGLLGRELVVLHGHLLRVGEAAIANAIEKSFPAPRVLL
ncbi:MAG TPA: hypothetical protein VH933_11695 [Aestuariivirgaceae bacterium]